jgi:hypothetical protein
LEEGMDGEGDLELWGFVGLFDVFSPWLFEFSLISFPFACSFV